MTIFQTEKFAYIQPFFLQSSTLNNPNTNTNKLSNYNVASSNIELQPNEINYYFSIYPPYVMIHNTGNVNGYIEYFHDILFRISY